MKPLAGLVLAALLVAPGSAAQSPSLELHELDFYLHAGALDGQPLAFYQAALDDALEDARLILRGTQGPVDSPCCTQIVPRAALTLYGDPADGGDLVDFDADLATLRTIAGGTPAVFLVTGLTTCGGEPAPTAVGCAETPSCSSAPGTVSVVTLEALALDLLGAAIAHERGHNACLSHTTVEPCDLMNPTLGGACLAASECTRYRDASTTASGTCSCQLEPASSQPDGTACDGGSFTGICSGAVCGPVGGEASAQLFAAIDPESSFDPAFTPQYDELIAGSGLTGGWAPRAAFPAGVTPTGLAAAPDRGVLYGVQSAGGDGELLELDPETGTVDRTTPLPGLGGLISLAYDPGGPGAADDRLIAVERREPTTAPAEQLEVLVSIDPDDGSQETLCNLVSNSQDTRFGFFPGLAYDVSRNRLVGAGGGGVFEIDPTDCSRSEIVQPGGTRGGDIVRIPAALGYSAEATRVFLIGNQSGPRTLFTVIDQSVEPAAVTTALGLEGFTPGALAAVPEPGAGPLGAFALLALAALRRRR